MDCGAAPAGASTSKDGLKLHRGDAAQSRPNRTAAPSNLTASILRKWRAQGDFIRFLDGDVRNAAVANLQYVSLPDALAHLGEWVTDIDMELTPAERALVQDPAWRAGLRFS